MSDRPRIAVVGATGAVGTVSQRRLLHDFLRIRHALHQRGDVTKDLPFAAQEQRKKPLLRGVLVFGMSR